MCRMFGMAAAAPRSCHRWLCEAPQSLRALSHDHADGWGIAIRDRGAWRLDRDTTCAAASERYAQVASAPTQLAIAHVRKRTVGATALANTHPFERDGFV